MWNAATWDITKIVHQHGRFGIPLSDLVDVLDHQSTSSSSSSSLKWPYSVLPCYNKNSSLSSSSSSSSNCCFLPEAEHQFHQELLTKSKTLGLVKGNYSLPLAIMESLRPKASSKQQQQQQQQQENNNNNSNNNNNNNNNNKQSRDPWIVAVKIKKNSPAYLSRQEAVKTFEKALVLEKESSTAVGLRRGRDNNDDDRDANANDTSNDDLSQTSNNNINIKKELADAKKKREEEYAELTKNLTALRKFTLGSDVLCPTGNNLQQQQKKQKAGGTKNGGDGDVIFVSNVDDEQRFGLESMVNRICACSSNNNNSNANTDDDEYEIFLCATSALQHTLYPNLPLAKDGLDLILAAGRFGISQINLGKILTSSTAYRCLEMWKVSGVVVSRNVIGLFCKESKVRDLMNRRYFMSECDPLLLVEPTTSTSSTSTNNNEEDRFRIVNGRFCDLLLFENSNNINNNNTENNVPQENQSTTTTSTSHAETLAFRDQLPFIAPAILTRALLIRFHLEKGASSQFTVFWFLNDIFSASLKEEVLDEACFVRACQEVGFRFFSTIKSTPTETATDVVTRRIPISNNGTVHRGAPTWNLIVEAPSTTSTSEENNNNNNNGQEDAAQEDDGDDDDNENEDDEDQNQNDHHRRSNRQQQKDDIQVPLFGQYGGNTKIATSAIPLHPDRAVEESIVNDFIDGSNCAICPANCFPASYTENAEQISQHVKNYWSSVKYDNSNKNNNKKQQKHPELLELKVPFGKSSKAVWASSSLRPILNNNSNNKTNNNKNNDNDARAALLANQCVQTISQYLTEAGSPGVRSLNFVGLKMDHSTSQRFLQLVKNATPDSLLHPSKLPFKIAYYKFGSHSNITGTAFYDPSRFNSDDEAVKALRSRPSISHGGGRTTINNNNTQGSAVATSSFGDGDGDGGVDDDNKSVATTAVTANTGGKAPPVSTSRNSSRHASIGFQTQLARARAGALTTSSRVSAEFLVVHHHQKLSSSTLTTTTSSRKPASKPIKWAFIDWLSPTLLALWKIVLDDLFKDFLVVMNNNNNINKQSPSASSTPPSTIRRYKLLDVLKRLPLSVACTLGIHDPHGVIENEVTADDLECPLENLREELRRKLFSQRTVKENLARSFAQSLHSLYVLGFVTLFSSSTSSSSPSSSSSSSSFGSSSMTPDSMQFQLNIDVDFRENIFFCQNRIAPGSHATSRSGVVNQQKNDKNDKNNDNNNSEDEDNEDGDVDQQQRHPEVRRVGSFTLPQQEQIMNNNDNDSCSSLSTIKLQLQNDFFLQIIQMCSSLYKTIMRHDRATIVRSLTGALQFSRQTANTLSCTSSGGGAESNNSNNNNNKAPPRPSTSYLSRLQETVNTLIFDVFKGNQILPESVIVEVAKEFSKFPGISLLREERKKKRRRRGRTNSNNNDDDDDTEEEETEDDEQKQPKPTPEIPASNIVEYLAHILPLRRHVEQFGNKKDYAELIEYVTNTNNSSDKQQQEQDDNEENGSSSDEDEDEVTSSSNDSSSEENDEEDEDDDSDDTKKNKSRRGLVKTLTKQDRVDKQANIDRKPIVRGKRFRETVLDIDDEIFEDWSDIQFFRVPKTGKEGLNDVFHSNRTGFQLIFLSFCRMFQLNNPCYEVYRKLKEKNSKNKNKKEEQDDDDDADDADSNLTKENNNNKDNDDDADRINRPAAFLSRLSIHERRKLFDRCLNSVVQLQQLGLLTKTKVNKRNTNDNNNNGTPSTSSSWTSADVWRRRNDQNDADHVTRDNNENNDDDNNKNNSANIDECKRFITSVLFANDLDYNKNLKSFVESRTRSLLHQKKISPETFEAAAESLINSGVASAGTNDIVSRSFMNVNPRVNNMEESVFPNGRGSDFGIRVERTRRKLAEIFCLKNASSEEKDDEQKNPDLQLETEILHHPTTGVIFAEAAFQNIMKQHGCSGSSSSLSLMPMPTVNLDSLNPHELVKEHLLRTNMVVPGEATKKKLVFNSGDAANQMIDAVETKVKLHVPSTTASNKNDSNNENSLTTNPSLASATKVNDEMKQLLSKLRHEVATSSIVSNAKVFPETASAASNKALRRRLCLNTTALLFLKNTVSARESCSLLSRWIVAFQEESVKQQKQKPLKNAAKNQATRMMKLPARRKRGQDNSSDDDDDDDDDDETTSSEEFNSSDDEDDDETTTTTSSENTSSSPTTQNTNNIGSNDASSFIGGGLLWNPNNSVNFTNILFLILSIYDITIDYPGVTEAMIAEGFRIPELATVSELQLLLDTLVEANYIERRRIAPSHDDGVEDVDDDVDFKTSQDSAFPEWIEEKNKNKNNKSSTIKQKKNQQFRNYYYVASSTIQDASVLVEKEFL